MMKKSIINILLGITLFGAGCTEESPITKNNEVDKPIEIDRSAFACGADVSWITWLEAKGYTFSNKNNIQKECMLLLRDDCGVNAIRLRVWVNPTEGWNNIHDVAIKARRANKLGQRVMIDFHFSDTWADPGKQETPAAWADMNLAQLKDAMASHITDMLVTLKNIGVEPEWVQIGNETKTGMMYPLGSVDAHFAELVDHGYGAVKAIFPNAKVIVHVNSGDKLELFKYIFSYLKNNNARYDMIGMSLYPDPSNWESSVNSCLENVKTLHDTYGKPLVIAEIGMDYREADIADLMMRAMVKGCKETGFVDGIFWWEPEAPAQEGYKKGCFDNGVPTKALDIFKEINDTNYD